MKKIIILLALVSANVGAISQAQYEVTTDAKHPEVKIFRGIVNKYLIENENTFTWMRSAKVGYKPDTSTVNAFERNKGNGLCYSVNEIVSFFGVNREKKTLASIAEAFNIKNVPTIIIMKDGIEKGRVVEYGKTGNWDKELAQILNTL